MTENNTIPPQEGNYFYRRNRTDEIEDDRMEGIENIRRINNHLQEVTLVKDDVVSYGFTNPGNLLEDFTPWITMLHLEKSISCIHKIQYVAMVLFEITTKSENRQTTHQSNSRISTDSDPWGRIKKIREQRTERYKKNAVPCIILFCGCVPWLY